MNSFSYFACRRILIVIVLLTAACDTGSRHSADVDVLRRGNGGEPVTLDPALAEDEHAFRILADLYEGLLTIDAAGSLVPGTAESWGPSPDGLEYRFRIRAAARWSNGAPVTAQHFVAAFRRVLAPGTRSPYAFLLKPIQNAEQVLAAEASPETLGVSAEDSSTLVIELEYPAPYFPHVLAMAVGAPRYPEIQNADEATGGRTQIISNGAYVLDTWQPGDKIRLRKNPHFHDAGNVQIDVVDYFAIVDEDTEYRRYRAGELDITASVPGSVIDDLRRTRPDELHVTPKLALYYIAFDLSEAPFDNRNLRRALTMAIDRDALVEVIGRGERPAYGVVPPGIDGYDNPVFSWRDDDAALRLDEARRHYELAGYSATMPLEAELLYDAGGVHETIALAVSAMWRNVLGAEISLRKMEWQQFLATRNNRPDWQMMRFAWTGDYPDPKTFTDLFRSNSPQNLPAYRESVYDDLSQQADASASPEERFRLLRGAESRLLDDYPIAPLYFYVSKHLASTRVAGFQPNLLDRQLTRYLALGPPR